MSSTMAPNVSEVGLSGRRTVYSMCGMCAVRCPMEVTVEDGRVVWLQGNRKRQGARHQSVREGRRRACRSSSTTTSGRRRRSSAWARVAVVSGGGRRGTRRSTTSPTSCTRRSTTFGARGIALSDRGRPFNDLTADLRPGARLAELFQPRRRAAAGNVHNAARSIYGFGHEGLIFDLKNTKHLVLYGRNVVESLMVKEAKAFMGAIANGNALHLHRSARQPSPRARRPAYWQVRPNSDYALNLAIIHEVLEQEAYDKDFVARFVSGMDYLREAVQGHDARMAGAHTGLPAEQIRAFVEEIAAEMPHVIFHPGWMTARHKQSFYVSRTALILNALMGNIEIPGGCVFGKPPEHLRPQGPESSDRPCARRSTSRGWTARAPPGRSGIRRSACCTRRSPRWRHGQPYGIGAYFAYRHDPLTGMPDPEATQRALDNLKLLVSIDVRYSETGWFSDVILPESTYLERANILCQMNGPVPVFAMRDQAIAPRFDSRPAWWIFREILHRMGIKEVLDFETHRGALELPARRHRRHRRRDARDRVSSAWPTRRR